MKYTRPVNILVEWSPRLVPPVNGERIAWDMDPNVDVDSSVTIGRSASFRGRSSGGD